MKAWEFDGVRMGYASVPNLLVEVWEPRWWQLQRWMKWCLNKRHYGTVDLLQGEKKLTLRVIKAEVADAWKTGRA